MSHARSIHLVCLLYLSWWGAMIASAAESERFVDLSVMVAPEYPCIWSAGFPPFQINHDRAIGPMSPVHREILAIDENTGTQFDAPAHSIPPVGSPFPDAGPMGRITGDKAPVWQFVGEACVVDCADLIDAGKPNQSGLVKRGRIEAWEKKHRPLSTGDVVLLASGYTDKFYRPYPEGERFLDAPLENACGAWPDPDPDCMAYLAGRKVMTLATDSPSMGPLPKELAADTHTAGLRHGMVWTELATGFGQLPPTGAAYCMLPVKHYGGAGGETRAFAVVDPALAKSLIESAKKQQVVDLSVLLSEELPSTWPGVGIGKHRQPYLRKILLTFEQTKGKGFAQTHIMDSHAGTHLVTPSFALPSKTGSDAPLAEPAKSWLAAFEAKHGPTGTSDITTEKVPLAQTCGAARIIDVRKLRGSAEKSAWPASPEITVADLENEEKQNGAFSPGEIVIFSCGWSDDYYKPAPEGDACFADPLSGKSEGWPAPGADAIAYLAKKGIRCVATDSPTIGGVEPKRSLETYWALGKNQMVAIEYLTNVASIAGKKATFLFAATKIKGCHGGPGRAIALY